VALSPSLTSGISIDDPVPWTPIYYTRRQKNEFSAMDPNVKLFLE
jgi:hypothetical protein